MKHRIFTKENFLSLFTAATCSLADYTGSLLTIPKPTQGNPAPTPLPLMEYINRNVEEPVEATEDIQSYYAGLHRLFVTDAQHTITTWYEREIEIKGDVRHNMAVPFTPNAVCKDTIEVPSTYFVKFHKNINFQDFHDTKKYNAKDIHSFFGIWDGIMSENIIPTVLAGKAVRDVVRKYGKTGDDYTLDVILFYIKQYTHKASIFEPSLYRAILDHLFTGEVLFAPVMGWASYQNAFYSSNFTHFTATDVMPRVVENAKDMHTFYVENMTNPFFGEEKTVDLYLCPSEKLQERHGFADKYRGKVDAVLFSPPYWDLELYPTGEQSTNTFTTYAEWLVGYWEATVALCADVMKPGAKFGFVIKNYNGNTISEDMRDAAKKHLHYTGHYFVGGNSHSNMEDLWMFVKK